MNHRLTPIRSGVPRHAFWIRRLLVLSLVLSPIPAVTWGQVLPRVIDPTGRSGEPRPTEKQQPIRPTPSPQEILPPIVVPPPEERLDKGPILRVVVKKINVVGSTVFSAAELAEATAPYENREVSTEDLEELRRVLTLLYVNKGYPNSGAIIPDQAVTDGTVTIQIIEGTLGDIRIEGTKWFRKGYLQDRLALGAAPPFNMNPLRNRMQLLLQDQRLERMNAELKPGAQPGEAVLDVQVQEANPIKAWIDLNNYQTPAVGGERASGTIMHQNLTGNGDTAMFTYGRSQGVDPLIETNYTLPINRYDTTLFFGYRRNDFQVITQPFEPLNIESKTEIFSVSLRQPVYRTLTDEVAVSLTGEYLSNKTTLLGRPFSFVLGAQDGVSNVAAIRFGQEWTHRTDSSVIALHSRFSLGIDALQATINSGPGADGQFFSWLGQANWVERFASTGIELVNRIDLQFANDHLFPLEQFSVGGRYSVRGYRENTLIRDNAFLYSIEPRFPLWTSKEGYDIVQFAPFIDVGRSWNTKDVTPDPVTLASIGAGLRFNLSDRAYASIYWGQRLNHVPIPPPGGNLQDHGVHVQIVVNVF